MKTTNTSVKVGLFILIGVILFIASVVLISNMSKIFMKGISAKATFQDVAGLNKGNNVWFAGVKVGVVKSLSFVSGKGVEVDFSIEDKSKDFIFRNSKVKVSSDGLIGNPILVISGGDISSGTIVDGHTFIVEKEDSQQDMLKTLQENNKNILSITSDLKVIVDKVEKGQGNLGKFLTDETLFANLSQTLNKLNTTAGEANSFAQNMNQFSKTLNDPQNLPYQLAHNTTIMPSLNETVSNLKTSSESLKSTASNANMLVNDVRTDVSKISSDFTRITNDKNSALGMLINSKESANVVQKTLYNLESGTQKLDEDLEAVQHSIFLRRFFKKKEKAKKEAANDSPVVSLEK
jgi:phospholipid/cholesterol/gamma-HCH transport system substrate-binding protein